MGSSVRNRENNHHHPHDGGASSSRFRPLKTVVDAKEDQIHEDGVTVGKISKSDVTSSVEKRFGNFSEGGHEDDLGWKTVGAKKMNKPSRSSFIEVFSVYVANLPSGCSAKYFKEIMKEFGVCVNTFIPKIQKIEGRTYGFARFLRVMDSKRLCILISKKKVEGRWLKAFPAKIKSSKTVTYRKGSVFHRLGNDSVGKKHKETTPTTKFRSFKDVLTNQNMSRVNSIVQVDACQMPFVENHAALCSVVDLDVLSKLHELLIWEEFKNVKLMYLGGLQVIFEFQDGEERKCQKYCSEVFSRAAPYNLNIIDSARIAWITVRGVNALYWKLDIIKEAVKQFGHILSSPTEFEFMSNLYSATFGVKTQHEERIKAVVNFDSKVGRSGCKIEEVLWNWKPDFLTHLHDSPSEEQDVMGSSPVIYDGDHSPVRSVPTDQIKANQNEHCFNSISGDLKDAPNIPTTIDAGDSDTLLGKSGGNPLKVHLVGLSDEEGILFENQVSASEVPECGTGESHQVKSCLEPCVNFVSPSHVNNFLKQDEFKKTYKRRPKGKLRAFWTQGPITRAKAKKIGALKTVDVNGSISEGIAVDDDNGCGDDSILGLFGDEDSMLGEMSDDDQSWFRRLKMMIIVFPILSTIHRMLIVVWRKFGSG